MIYIFKFIDFIIALFNQLDLIQILLFAFMGIFLLASIYSLIVIFVNEIHIKKEFEKRKETRSKGSVL